MYEKQWLKELLEALDGHTMASLVEARRMLAHSHKPVADFIAGLKQEAINISYDELHFDAKN